MVSIGVAVFESLLDGCHDLFRGALLPLVEILGDESVEHLDGHVSLLLDLPVNMGEEIIDELAFVVLQLDKVGCEWRDCG